MAALTDEEIAEAVASVDPATEGFQFQQTMIRVKDPRKSLKFYTEVLGMRLLYHLSMPAMKFTVYFLGFENEEDIPKDPEERKKFCFTRKGCLELTHNWGTETDESQKYHSGNTEPRGFGHIGFTVPDIHAACERFEKLGVPFKKRLVDGTMKTIAFILDPDGYWVEILSPNYL